MIATTKSLLRCLVPLIALGALTLGSPALASAGSAHCAKHSGTLATHYDSIVYHSGGSLYGCVVVHSRAVTERAGPWSARTKIAFDGSTLAWTVPHTVSGASTDRVFAQDLTDGKRWLSGTRLIPQGVGRPFADGRVQRLLVFGDSAAWVTRTSDVVLAMREPADVPSAIGTLPGALTPVKQLLLVGSFPTVAPATLAATARLHDTDGGDGDECGGTDEFALTVQPQSSQDAIGAKWTTSWENDTDSVCTG
jgi:hypothetical protein